MEQQDQRRTAAPFLAVGALFGLLGVALGAFASHALARDLDPQALDWLATASQYFLLHGVALLGLQATMTGGSGRKLLPLAAWGIIAGTLFFAGSLALLALGGPHALVWLTPLGGGLLLLSWAALLLAGLLYLRG